MYVFFNQKPLSRLGFEPAFFNLSFILYFFSYFLIANGSCGAGENFLKTFTLRVA